MARRVVSVSLPPKKLDTEVSKLFGSHVPVLEKKTLFKGGKPLASGYRKQPRRQS